MFVTIALIIASSIIIPNRALPSATEQNRTVVFFPTPGEVSRLCLALARRPAAVAFGGMEAERRRRVVERALCERETDRV